MSDPNQPAEGDPFAPPPADGSANIPGIPGIGDKTAKKLIRDFGNIENLVARASELKGKQKENLETYADQALLSKDLATIIIDAPIETVWEILADARSYSDWAMMSVSKLEMEGSPTADGVGARLDIVD